MITNNNIDQLFGTPINTAIKPKTPAKTNALITVGGIVILMFAIYGGYVLYHKHKPKPELK